ncbi:MAG: FAD-binding oxidoreductase [Bacteriovoracaceae bacterium]|nr:FAD-binding oxidoreductase [Bacteriovoracaceae bacterium]
MKTKIFSDEQELVNHIKTQVPTFYFSSKTSTVIPYDKMEEYLSVGKDEKYFLGDLSQIPSQISLDENNYLVVRGAYTWKDAKAYLQSHGRNIMTSPTEELALTLAGAATSCTGERCFGFGNLRSQIVSIKYFNHQGKEITLMADRDLPDFPGKAAYAHEFEHYKNFKNAPYPRFEKETDLMIGTEGQLGVISEMTIKTTPLDAVQYYFLTLPRWEKDYQPHLEIFHKVQKLRGKILSCEFLDSNCFTYLPEDDRLGNEEDVIFLEIRTEYFEDVYENFLKDLTHMTEDQMFSMTEKKFHEVRASVPRAVFEKNTHMGVIKMGTDVQVSGDDYRDLFDYYRQCSYAGVGYNLFGHFGDAHLHFNFMPLPQDVNHCAKYLTDLYIKVATWKGSPFAEHGIGLIKQKFIRNFWKPIHFEVFAELKRKHDPKGQFFPQGFMSLTSDQSYKG